MKENLKIGKKENFVKNNTLKIAAKQKRAPDENSYFFSFLFFEKK